MATQTGKKAKPKSAAPTNMNDLVPGGMTEAMVKGALVTEDPTLDHGTVAKLVWGDAVKALIKVRGGNRTYNEWLALVGDDAQAEDVPVITSLPEAEPTDEGTKRRDRTVALDSLDAEPKPKKKGKKKGKSKKADPDSALDDLLAAITNPDKPAFTDESEPSIEESGHSLFIGMPTTRDYIFDGHAGAGPSGAERWMNCTASLDASRRVIERMTPTQQVEFSRGSEAARQGTTAHAAAESEARLMLGEIDEAEHNMNLLQLSALPDAGEEYDEEMGEWLTEYGDIIRQLHQDGHPILIEQRVTAAIPLLTVDADGDRDIHEIVGSADAIAMPIPAEPVLTVADLKYGSGKNVEAEDNPQAMIYALAVLAMLIEMGLDIFDKKVLHHIDLVIVQPRLGGTKTWSITVDELLDWQDEKLTPALTHALAGPKGGAAYVPSDTACEFCPARGNCAAMLEHRMSKATELFDVIQQHEVENGPSAPLDMDLLDHARLADLLDQVSGLVKVHDDLKAEAQRRLYRGEAVPGFQLVNYQPPRHWDEGADEVLEDEPALWTAPKLKSPTQAIDALAVRAEGKTLKARKEAAAATLAELIVTPEVRPVVAKDGDRRKKWEARPPEEMFDALPPLDETGE